MADKVWTEEDIMAIRASTEKYLEEAAKYRAESEKYRAESDKYRAEADATRARTEKHLEESAKYRDESEKYRAEADATRARTEKHLEESAKYRDESEKYRAEIDATRARTEKHLEGAAKYREESEKYRAQADKTRSETEALMKEFKRGMVELRREVGGISDSNGMVAEEVFYTALDNRMTLGGVVFDDIESGGRGRKKKLPNGERIRGQYDIILRNCTSVAIVEAKYRVRSEDVKRLVDVQLPRFKQIYPEYKDFTVYLGIGGLSFEEDVEEEALRQGIATLKLNGDSVVEINDQNIKAWN